MKDGFFAKRVAELREKKKVSARDMSLSLGYSEGYINGIEIGKAYPSMAAFFDICDYLGVTPKEFFDDGNSDPAFLQEIISDLKKLNAKQLEQISGLVKSLGQK